MAEVGDRRFAERALAALDEKLMAPKFSEHDPEMTQMLRPRPAVDKNVIKKYQDEPSQEGPQDVVHERLERRRRVAQPERHHQELVEPIVSPERRLVDVGGAHADLVVPRP